MPDQSLFCSQSFSKQNVNAFIVGVRSADSKQKAVSQLTKSEKNWQNDLISKKSEICTYRSRINQIIQDINFNRCEFKTYIW